MKKIILTLVLLAGITSTPSFAKTYISGSVGLGTPGDWKETGWADQELDSAVAWNGAVGNNFGSYRLEAALGYEKHDFTNSPDNASLLTVMANGYYDFDSGSKVIPYLMAGAGISSVDVSWSSDSSTSFVWQVGAGLGFKVDDNVTMDLGYRYIKPEGVECPYDNNDVSWHSQHIMAGVRYQF
jgi:outer membrane autotransporter protein